jgi:hypothetical protein
VESRPKIAASRWLGIAVAIVVCGGCAARTPSTPARAAVTGGCSQRTPAACEAPCFAGDAVACTLFGEATKGTAEAPVRLPQDTPRARKALERGCQLGNLDACRARVDIDYDAVGAGVACAGWEDLCKRGDRASCTFFAQCLDHNDHFRRDRPEALRIFREGCDAGERFACRELGFHVMEGDGVPKDLAKGFGLLDRACRMDDPYACGHVGLRLELGQGAPRDLDRARALYRMACARGIRPIPCEGLRRLGEEPPSVLASSADATESIHVSERFDWEWRLPANWQFVPPASLELADAPADAEIVAARSRTGTERQSVMIVVGACAKDTTAAYKDRYKATVEAAGRTAKGWLAGHGIADATVGPDDFWGNDSVRVAGRLAAPDARHVTVTVFCRQDKLFETRCLGPRSAGNAPCVDALAALTFHEPKRDPKENPRVLHLRDKRFGIAFDAPDDSWLGMGPYVRGGEISWFWSYDHRTIDLMVIQIGETPDSAFERFAEFMASGKGLKVTRMQSELGGSPSLHFVVEEKDGAAKDVFAQRRGGFAYVLMIEAPKRDTDLLAKARAGLRFDEPPAP